MLFKPTLGLTLGGGGARGGAHLGVLRVLEEIGYHPDVIVGTSIGGYVAALYGLGWPLSEVESYFAETDFPEMVELDRSGSGLMSTRLLEENLTAIFGDKDLRDLKPRIAFMAADAQHYRRVLLDQGPVVQAILATSALPGIFPPLEWGDHLLVDAGISDNVPTQATYQLGAERVVAVDLLEGAVASETMTGAGVLDQRLERVFYWLLSLSKRQKAFDNLVNAIAYSQNLLVQYHLIIYPPDVLLRPFIDGVSLFAMDKFMLAVDAGERAARESAGEIRSLMRNRFRRGRRLPTLENLPPIRSVNDGS